MKLSSLFAAALVATSSAVALVPSKAEAYGHYDRICTNAVVYAPVSNVRMYPSLNAPVTYQVKTVRTLVVADAYYMGAFYKILNEEYKGGYIHYSQVAVSGCTYRF